MPGVRWSAIRPWPPPTPTTILDLAERLHRLAEQQAECARYIRSLRSGDSIHRRQRPRSVNGARPAPGDAPAPAPRRNRRPFGDASFNRPCLDLLRRPTAPVAQVSPTPPPAAEAPRVVAATPVATAPLPSPAPAPPVPAATVVASPPPLLRCRTRATPRPPVPSVYTPVAPRAAPGPRRNRPMDRHRPGAEPAATGRPDHPVPRRSLGTPDVPGTVGTPVAPLPGAAPVAEVLVAVPAPLPVATVAPSPTRHPGPRGRAGSREGAHSPHGTTTTSPSCSTRWTRHAGPCPVAPGDVVTTD